MDSEKTPHPLGAPKRGLSRLLDGLEGARRALKEFLYGLTVHEMEVEMRKARGQVNNLFMLIVFGDLVGLPLLPPYYTLRLLPHIVPDINRWKRSVLREKDLTEVMASDV
jgi:hypothetical protein